MSWYLDPPTIAADVAQDFYNITGFQLDLTDLSREEVIKVTQLSIALSHAYAQIDRVADDFFPGTASEAALEKHLAARGLPGREPDSPSDGTIAWTGGTSGTLIPAGTQVRLVSNGNLYASTADATLDGSGNASAVPFQSVLNGQDQNLDTTDNSFELVQPISGVPSSCTNDGLFLDGRDQETPEEMLARITEHDQQPNSGGNLTAYEEEAIASSSEVTSAKAVKQPRGADTVNVIITSGTTDIETAVNNGDPVERIPSDGLIATVQAALEAWNPTTDDVLVVGPTEDSFDTTITYDLYDESLRSQVEAQIENLWAIFIYEAVSNEFVDPTTLEREIDAAIGSLILRRRVSDFGDGVPEYLVPAGHLLKPGTLTQNSFS